VSAADGCLVVLWTAATLYAVLGGADFGAGLWDLLAGGDAAGRRPRALIDRALSPGWEANHGWLVFSGVVLWTAFPTAFSAIFTPLWIPLSLAALGVVVRGAGFAFRAASGGLRIRRVHGALFGVASLLTPFFLGAALGGIASERVPPSGGSGDIVTSWANPSGVVVGLLAVAACAFLAAVYMVTESRHVGDPALERYFATRALIASAVAAALAVAGVVVLHEDAAYVGDRLTGEALPLVVAAAVLGAGAPLLLRRHPAWSRLLAAGSVAAVTWAWGVAQWPYLLPTRLTVDDAAGDPETLRWVLVIFAVAIVVVVPALVLLFTLAQRGRLEEDTPP
jgi:cytochrome d ubiquinol oxidase subunit II